MRGGTKSGRTVGRKIYDWEIAFELFGPKFEVLPGFCGIQPLFEPRGVIAVLDGKRWQLRRFAACKLRIRRPKIFLQNPIGPSISKNMVNIRQQHKVANTKNK